MNGLRPEDEFIFGGTIRAIPPSAATDEVWCDYLFFDDNLPQQVWEWWCHTPSSFWFALLRDTATDTIIKTCTVEEAETAANAP